MRVQLKLLAFISFFWLSFLILIRILFLTYNYDYAAQLTLTEILKIFMHGLHMDASIAGYLLMFAGLTLSSYIIFPSKWIVYGFHTVNITALLLFCIITIVDVELYRHWGFRLNTTPFFYMGSGAIGSVDPGVAVRLIIILIVLFSLSLYLYKKILSSRFQELRSFERSSLYVIVPVTAAMIIPVRGSFTVAPMNTGFVYFHKTKPFANHAAINVVWNFTYSLRKGSHIVYPENFLDQHLTKKYFDDFHNQSDSTFYFLKNKRPNIVLILLESYTASIIEPLGGSNNITPNVNRLCHEGILFDNFYASGDRTDKGLISILSGYPAQPQTSIIKYPDKTQHLPYLPKAIQSLGYKTSFVYGGDIDFANFRSYLTNCGFDNITEGEDFPEEWDESKWGVHDHFVFGRALQECDSSANPFFKIILSLSSHEPFDVPMERVIPGTTAEAMFLNSCYYTDKSLGEFIEKAKQQEWWNNTVVIITADHGHRHPGNKELKDKERFRVPLLLLGGALQMRDTVIHTVGNQTDIANTLLAQLDAPNPAFKFSKNLFDFRAQSFAFYFFNDGFGFVSPGKYIIHDNPGKQFLREEGASEEDLKRCKAYQQTLYTDYNKR